jgi:hypothetical protein
MRGSFLLLAKNYDGKGLSALLDWHTATIAENGYGALFIVGDIIV